MGMSSEISTSTLEKFTTFGDLLRFLRRRAGITQLELSIAVGYSDAQISRLEQNLRMPDIPTIGARFVSALGLEDEPKAVARLLDLAANVRREDAPALGLCPYKGLNYFDEADADLFMGREALTAKLTERVLSLASSSEAGKERFLAIVGASGSGKSSLVRAGLVPALRWNKTSANWPVYIFNPTTHPLESLAACLTEEVGSVAATATLMDDLGREPRSLSLFIKRLLRPAGAAHLLLVVDQFEELFALCRSEEERTAFINNLLTAASEAGGPAIIVITLRADFYAYCAGYLELRQALAGRQEYIGAMSDEGLHRAIEEPARRGRWEFEPGLVNLLLHDVGAYAGHTAEPGALPLLSHALLETWQRRRGRTMTLSGYTSSGRVRGAISETAETVFTDQFTREQQAIARRIFLRLTELGDGTATGDTRRRATFDELILKPEEAATTQIVLKALADARLITISEDSAEVAHEALIREWPTLRGWLEDNREGLRLHRHLTDVALEWLASSRDPDLLYRGARLAQAREWAAIHEEEMNAQESEFLEASVASGERDAAEREIQHQRELEAAQKLAEAERVAFSRELSAASVSNLEADPERSILLAIQAISTTYAADKTWTAEAEDALHRALLESRLQLTLRGQTDRVWSVAFSPNGDQIATASDDGTARVWDASTGKELLCLPTNATRGHHGMAFRPDGKQLATASDIRTAKVWDAITGQELLTLRGHTNWISGVAFSPDGKRLATSSVDGTAKVWDATTGQEQLSLRGHALEVWDVAFSPDGKRLVTASQDGKAKVWDATTGNLLLTFSGHTAAVDSLSFSPDGSRLATSGVDRGVKIWDSNTGQELLTLRGHTGEIWDVAFSPDGKRLASASSDGKVKVWDTLTGQELFTLNGHTAPVVGVAFSPDCVGAPDAVAEQCGTRLATASWDGTTRVWNASFSRELLTLYLPNASSGAFSPDGRLTASGYGDGSVKLWDLSSAFQETHNGDDPTLSAGSLLQTLIGHTDAVDSLAFSPDGQRLASTAEDHTVKIWDVTTGADLLTLPGQDGGAIIVAFSPDGKRLATASDDFIVKLWNISGNAVQELLTIFIRSKINSLAFSPDGKHLVTAHREGIAKVWDVLTSKGLLYLRGHTDSVYYISFSQDGTRLATASDDGTARVWGAASGRELFTLRGHTGWVNGVAFSPDGSRLATAGQDGTTKLWDAKTGQELLTLRGNTDAVLGLAFSPDGSRLLSAGADGTMRVYLLRIEDLMELGRKRLTRSFTGKECQQYLHLTQGQCPEDSAPVVSAPTSVPASTNLAPQPEGAKSKVCEVTDKTGLHDRYFNQLAYLGVQKAVDSFGWQSAVLESQQPADYAKNINQFLNSNCDLIVLPTGIYYSDEVQDLAKANPEQKFQIMDMAYDPPLDNTWGQEFSMNQAAFLAGYVAASVTKTGKVATFGGVKFPEVTDFMNGFALGVAYYNEKNGSQVEVLGWDVQKQDGLFAGNFESTDDGYRIGKALMDQGADIVLPVADRVGLGAAAAVKEHGNAYLIGVDSDWTVTYPEYAGIILTSIMKRLDVSVISAVQAIVDGTFTGGTHVGTLENDGVSIAPFHNLDGLITAQVRADLDQIKSDIIAGKIKTKP
jgi:WD40 repeat protein/basic membrane lipoprotein Med (substrate-binding protein (PBP1-ABC) superfamily)